MSQENDVREGLPFVVELVEQYNDGIWTRLELFAEIFRQLGDGNVDCAIETLPEELRSKFVAWAKERYDNDVDPSEYFYIGGEGYREAPPEAFFAIRHWFARHRNDAP